MNCGFDLVVALDCFCEGGLDSAMLRFSVGKSRVGGCVQMRASIHLCVCVCV